MTKTPTRPAAVMAVLATLSFLVAGCGGGPAHNSVANLGSAKTTITQSAAPAGSSSSGSSGPTEAQMVKYAVCMRSHGEPNFPDPSPSPGGGYAFRVLPGLNPRSPTPQFRSASKACQKDVPPSIANVNPAQMAANALKWTDCMRSHGEPDFPDPNGQGLIQITNQTGIMDPNSPQFQKAEKACQGPGSGQFDVEMPSRSGG